MESSAEAGASIAKTRFDTHSDNSDDEVRNHNTRRNHPVIILISVTTTIAAKLIKKHGSNNYHVDNTEHADSCRSCSYL
jgi:hypothetical protein